MNLTEKISYIRGLCDGLELDESKPEVKVLNAIVDLLDDMAFEVSDMEELYDELSAQVDEIDQDLADVESDVYDDEDYDIEDYDDEDDDYDFDDEENPFYEVTCDSCGQKLNVSEDVLLEGEIECPNCGENLEFDFSGSFFSNRQMLNELVVILFISILLMYFILAAQFESFLQPLIVLLEIPIDVAASLLVLWICGHTMNLMSAIGIVVTCGIIINDSILKLDAINELRKEGVPLMEAIHEAGRRRLRPIIMTSLTTIFGMVPLLFTFDMGSELQKPLSIAMISAMLIGTAVSLFVIPLIYWFIYRKHEVGNLNVEN